MLRKNTAGQFVHFAGVDSTTGAAKTGVSWTMRRCLDGTFAAGGGTVSEDGTTGWYKVALAQADTNGNNCGYFFTGTGAIPVCINVVTTACDPTSTAFGLSIAKTTNITGFNDIAATDIVSSGAITTSGGAVSTVTAVTNNVNAVLANTAHGGAAASMNLASGLTANITGNLSGSVGSVTGAVGSVTGAVGSVTGAVGSVAGNVGGNVVGSVGSVAAGGITAASIATGAVDADAIAADAVTEIQSGLALAVDLATVDTVVDAIKVQTDKLTFTVANQIDANVQYVNDTQVQGTGAGGDEWRPV